MFIFIHLCIYSIIFKLDILPTTFGIPLRRFGFPSVREGHYNILGTSNRKCVVEITYSDFTTLI